MSSKEMNLDFKTNPFPSQNGLIEHNDFDAFTEKLRAYTGWKKDSPQYLALIDVNETFYECLKDQVKAEWQGNCFLKTFGILHQFCTNN